MKRREEAMLKFLTKKKNLEIERDAYFGEVEYHFRSLLGSVELDKDTLTGSSTWLSNQPVHLKVIALQAKFNDDNEEYDDYIYCCLFENDDYYRIHRNKSIYFKYNDKMYEIKVKTEEYEYGTGNHTVWIDVFEFGESVFCCGPDSIEAFYDGYHINQKILDKTLYKSYQLIIDYNTNIIFEVIKRIKEKDRSRTNKK